MQLHLLSRCRGASLGAPLVPYKVCAYSDCCVDLTVDDRHDRWWDRSGHVMAVLPHNLYLVSLDGSRRVTQSMRAQLKPMYALNFHRFTAAPSQDDAIGPGSNLRLLTARAARRQLPPLAQMPRQPPPSLIQSGSRSSPCVASTLMSSTRNCARARPLSPGDIDWINWRLAKLAVD